MNQSDVLETLQQLAEHNGNIEVVWLYGSRVKGTADQESDYDLAIALSPLEEKRDPFYTEELAYQWSQSVGVSVSIVDINQIPTPLAYNVINEGQVVMCVNSLRLHTEQARVWSLWEEYRYEYVKNRA